MKKTKIWALSLLGLATIGFTSCEPDNDNPNANGPTINVIDPSAANITVEPNVSIPVEVVASTNDKLESFKVERDFGGVSTTIIDSVLENGITSFTFVDTLFSSSIEGTVEFTFFVEDNKGNSSIDKLTVNVANSLSDTTSGMIWNINGPNEGAWSLVDDEAVPASADSTNKDLLDEDNGGPVYPASFGSANGTMFVLASDSVDFYNTTLTEITDEYENGTALSSTGTLAADDVVVAYNTRFPQEYIVILVTEVNSTPFPPVGDNLDNVKFVYRK